MLNQTSAAPRPGHARATPLSKNMSTAVTTLALESTLVIWAGRQAAASGILSPEKQRALQGQPQGFGIMLAASGRSNLGLGLIKPWTGIGQISNLGWSNP